MDAVIGQMTMVKLILWSLLLVAVFGCSIDTSADQQNDGGDSNSLAITTDGSYAVQLATDVPECQRHLDGRLVQLRFAEDGSGESRRDEGLAVAITVVGDLDSGDALTPDNSGQDRFFEVQLTTPRGVVYQYSSAGQGDLPAEGDAHAALTVLEATRFALSGRLWVDRLEPVGGGGADVAPASLRGTFTCARWMDASDGP